MEPAVEQHQPERSQQEVDLGTIHETLVRLSTFPEAAKKSFADALPGSLLGTAGMLFSAALDDAKVAAAAKVEASSSGAEVVEGELTVATEACSTAQAVAVAAQQELETLEKTSDEVSAALVSFQEEHKAFEFSTAAKLEKYAALKQEHVCSEEVLQGPMKFMVSGEWDDEGAKKAGWVAVQQLLEKARADKVLLAAAQHALTTPSVERRPFDHMTVDAVRGTLDSRQDALRQELEAATPEEKHVRAELLGLWAITECEQERAEAAQTAATTARRGEKRARDGLAKAKASLEKTKRRKDDLVASRVAEQQYLLDLEEAVAATKRLRTALGGDVVQQAPQAPRPPERGPAEPESAPAADQSSDVKTVPPTLEGVTLATSALGA